MRFGDTPADLGMPALSDAEQQMIMHVELPILAGHVIMATDMLESMKKPTGSTPPYPTVVPMRRA
jgi:uncharacterized glyoxalase superfamily protein PhnB